MLIFGWNFVVQNSLGFLMDRFQCLEMVWYIQECHMVKFSKHKMKLKTSPKVGVKQTLQCQC